jgi:hypothetical protein
MENRRYSLRKLITYLLVMRDFPSAYEFMDKYGNRYPNDDFKVHDMRKELDILFEKMAEESNKLDEGNIILNWIDNVPYDKLAELPWVKSQIESGIKFENAYTTMPWTTWTMKTIFSGKGAISGKLYGRGKIGEKQGEYPLYDYLKEQGYNLHYSGTEPYSRKWYVEECLCKLEKIDVSRLSTRSQWLGVCKMLKTSGKSFTLIHNLAEVHPAYGCIYLDYMDWRGPGRRTEEEKTVSRNYLDKRIEWYSRFYGERSTKIWMSDHGDGRIYDRDTNKNVIVDFYKETKCHVIFGASGMNIKKIRETRFFSYECFINFVKYLASGSEKMYDSIFLPYIVYENLDKYAASEVNRVLEIEEAERQEIKGTWQQYIGVREEKFKYIRFYDGEERFFVLPNEDENEIDNPEYGDDVERLRDIVKKREFADIYNEEFFVQSRRLYEKQVKE